MIIHPDSDQLLTQLPADSVLCLLVIDFFTLLIYTKRSLINHFFFFHIPQGETSLALNVKLFL